MSIQITRKLEFDAGHRLIKHESKCRHVHGHRYVVELTCSATSLDEVGRVIDFGVVKQIVGGWLDDHWDHGFIFQKGDPIEAFLVEQDMRRYELDTPPTAENMCVVLHGMAQGLLDGYDIKVVNVRLWETPNCYADSNAIVRDR